MRQPDLAISSRLRRILAAFALAAAAAAFAAPAQASAQSPAGLIVQPFPGTPDASPQTDVGFPLLAPSQIKALTVNGSRSGRHRGRLITLAGNGSAFVPFRPFSDGERVSVRASLGSLAAATATGASDGTALSWSFTVAAPLPEPTAPAPLARPAKLDPGGKTHTFNSEPWLHPPVVGVTGTDPDPSIGYVFADAEHSLQPGPLIFNPQGQLVYFQPLQQSAAFNVQVQTYQGQSVMTYWQGYVKSGFGIGLDVILNHNYQQVAVVRAGHGYHADLHEFQITPSGNAFITAFAPVKADLRPVGGPRHGMLMDSIIQEINIATGQVLWEWHASGHVHLSETYEGAPYNSNPYDFFHLNSIQQLPNGNLLISARHMWSLYEINMRTGRIALVIGGKHSSFRMGPGAQFAWQHNARMQPDGTITLFDNGFNGGSQPESQSRAMRIRLHPRRRRVTLVSAFTNNPAQLAASQGSTQPLSDGNTFVGWGAAPYMSEFGPHGRQLFSIHFAPGLESYRALRFPWWGQPTTPPSIAIAATQQGTVVYASWDGATTVASWRVLAGPAPTSVAPVGQFAMASFETTMSVASMQPYFEVQALDSAGHVLGTSPVAVRPSYVVPKRVVRTARAR